MMSGEGAGLTRRRMESWHSTSSSLSSSEGNKSEHVALGRTLHPELLDNKNSLSDWRNPCSGRDEEGAASERGPAEGASSPVSDSGSDSSYWDDAPELTERRPSSILFREDSSLADEISETYFGATEKCSDNWLIQQEENPGLLMSETSFGSKPEESGKVVSETSTSWLEERLARDLSGIIPSFDFTTTPSLDFGATPTVVADRGRLYSSTSEGETSSLRSETEESSSHETSSASCEMVRPRPPRHSWAGHLEVIDSDSSTLDLKANRKRTKRNKNRRIVTSLIVNTNANLNSIVNENIGNEDTLKFHSLNRCTDVLGAKIPGLKYLVKSKSRTSELVIEKERIVIKFKNKDYLCSSVKRQKRKVVLHLLDITNCLVLTATNTLIIQFKKSSKSEQVKGSTTLERLSSMTSRSSSLNRSLFSECEAEISEVEVGRFSNCVELASLVLRARQVLLPKSILKRGSMKGKSLQPVLVQPLQLPKTPKPILRNLNSLSSTVTDESDQLIHQWISYV